MIRPPAGPIRLGIVAAVSVQTLGGTLWAALLLAAGFAVLWVARQTEW